MNFADVNVLLAAMHSDAAHHAICRDWLAAQRFTEGGFAVSTLVLSACVRLSTNPRVFEKPASMEAALAFCSGILEDPNCSRLEPGNRHWSLFASLCSLSNARGNLVTDAWFAALAMEHNCTFVTFDRDFRKFPGLRTATPLIAS